MFFRVSVNTLVQVLHTLLTDYRYLTLWLLSLRQASLLTSARDQLGLQDIQSVLRAIQNPTVRPAKSSSYTIDYLERSAGYLILQYDIVRPMLPSLPSLVIRPVGSPFRDVLLALPGMAWMEVIVKTSSKFLPLRRRIVS